LTKKVSIKMTSAVFLAIVLVAGTFVLAFPSFMIGAAQASSDRDKDHDEDDEKSYGKDRDRDDKSRDHTDDNNGYGYESTKYSEYIDKRYNSYDSEYGMDNDYNDRYGKDSYESQYSTYGKDNSYKSKEDSSSSSVNIKKVKCNNINVNLNGIDVNVGVPNGNGAIAEAQAAEDEGTSSYGSDETGYGSSVESSNNNNDFKFVCKNNNNNTVVVVNETIPEPPDTITCEECFTEVLNATELERFLDEAFIPNATIEQACIVFSSGLVTEEALREVLEIALSETDERIDDIIECLLEAGIEFYPEEEENQISAQEGALEISGGIFNLP
jgi:hypothetical protein